METKQKKSKSFLRKIAFASGDIFGGGSFNIINFLYPGFLAFVVGIDPFWSSFIMIVSRIYNILLDPFIGWLSDRTNSRFGKRRLYLIISAPLVIVGLFLMFYPFNFQNKTYQIIAVFISYIIFVSIQSLAMIPYFSLSGEITNDYQERASFNTYRLIFSISASIICVALPGFIVNSFENIQTGYKVMSLTFGALFGIGLLFSGFFAKEEIISPPVKAKFNFKTIFEPLKSKPFRQYLYLMFISAMTMAVMSGMFIFFVDFYMLKDLTFVGENKYYATLAATVMLIAQIIGLPIVLKIVQKRGKTFTYRLGALLWISASLPIFLIPANGGFIYLFALAILLGFGMSGPGLIPHSMFGDVADAAQLQFKKRIEGQMSGITNFVDQIAQGLGLASAMFILGLAKFQERDLFSPPIREQPESALIALRAIMSLTPLILLSIGIVVTLFYKIDAKEQQRIKEEISLLERDINE